MEGIADDIETYMAMSGRDLNFGSSTEVIALHETSSD
jgi:hypothetical protein